MARVKKAIVAGLGAGVAAAAVYLQSHSFKLDAETIGAAVVALVVAGVPVGWATYQARNAVAP